MNPSKIRRLIEDNRLMDAICALVEWCLNSRDERLRETIHQIARDYEKWLKYRGDYPQNKAYYDERIVGIKDHLLHLLDLLADKAVLFDKEEAPASPPSPEPTSPPSFPTDSGGFELEMDGREATKGAGDTPDDRADAQVVNTGFAADASPGNPLPKDRTLAAGTAYYFWLEVGERMADSIETAPVPLPLEQLPAEAVLDVVLYAVGDGFTLQPGASIGQLKLTGDNKAIVAAQPLQPFQLSVEDAIAGKRLFFPLKTQAGEGKAYLKCNIYCQGILVQSRHIKAEVRANPAAHTAGLTSELLYNLANKLTPEQLNRYRPHRLSVLLSENDQASHSLQLFGAHQFKNDANFGEGEISDYLQQIRGALRKATWGNEKELTPNDFKTTQYRYQPGQVTQAQLFGDLLSLATRGYKLYRALVNGLSGGGRDQVKTFEALMLQPGYVQLVLQKGARQVLPIACLYDYPLDTGMPDDAYQLCPAFLTALKGAAPLQDCDCFLGNCPSRGNDLVICPSGFWGFRHYLGMPQSIKNAPFAPAEIFYDGKPEFAMAVWNSDDFRLGAQHIQQLRKETSIQWQYADERNATLSMLQDRQLKFVYFYCHGGVGNSGPYLLVGKNPLYVISPDNIPAKDIYWEETHPLVFINGCHTTALSPEQALSFVSTFVEDAQCSGVIGTEITIFEPLAVAFSEAFIARFRGGEPVGKAIRDARLDLLKQLNPLGLVYVPFVLGGLQLVKK